MRRPRPPLLNPGRVRARDSGGNDGAAKPEVAVVELGGQIPDQPVDECCDVAGFGELAES
jgi:hypothetical protein